MESGSITSWQIERGIMEIVENFIWGVLKSLQTVIAPWNQKMLKPTQHIKKQRHHFAIKGPYNQSFGFSSSHVWMWEMDHKEGWAQANWCFWITVLEKTPENPLGCEEIKLINPKGNQPWIFTEKTEIEAETAILWPPDAKSWLICKDPDAGKDWRQEKGTTEDEMVGWHHQLNGHEFEQIPGDSEGQGNLVCWSPWSRKELDVT